MTRRLLAAYDSWDEVDGEPLIVGYSIAWEEDGKQYKIDHEGPTFNLEQLDAPEPILPEHLTTPWVESYLEASKSLPPSTFIKSNNAIRYEPSNPTLLSELMRKEIEIYMTLVRSPHPNICPFYGCVREGQQVTALALKRIPHAFPYKWKKAEIPVPKLNLLRGLKRGLDHLHSLGIAHNDINRNNVRLDESFSPVIIDFNSALPEGTPLTVGGTPGWLCTTKVSSKSNDLFGLGMFAQWLDGREIDAFEDLDSMRPWTEDYLVPKIMVVATPAGLCKDISVRAFYSGAHLTLSNGTAESNCIGIPTHLLNGRLVLTSAQSPEQFEQAWIKACSGLRSDEADVVLFPVSSDIISEDSAELRLLRNLLFTLPHNLRHPRMQPSIVLIDNHSNLSTRHDWRRLENILKALVEDIWRPTEDALSNSNELFSNFVLVQPGGWFSWNRIRVYYWKTLDTTRPSFQQTPHLVAPDDVLEFVLDPPKRGNGKEWGLLNRFRGCFGIDDPTLLAFVATQAALTACAAYKLAWAS